MKHSENDATNSVKKAIKERTVIEKERAKFLVNGKNEVSVCTVNECKGHFCGTLNGVFVTTGRAKFRMATERNEFEFTAMGAAIHGTTKRRIATIYHFFYVFNDRRTWV